MSTSISLPVLDDSMDVRFGASYAERRKLRMRFHDARTKSERSTFAKY